MNLCPGCQVDHDAIADSLKQPRGSEDQDLALVIVYGCAECQKAFPEVKK